MFVTTTLINKSKYGAGLQLYPSSHTLTHTKVSNSGFFSILIKFESFYARNKAIKASIP